MTWEGEPSAVGHALAGTELEAEVAHLFETVPGTGLLLNVTGAKVVSVS